MRGAQDTEYAAFDKAYKEADLSMGDRDALMGISIVLCFFEMRDSLRVSAKLYETVEKKFNLIGCTAVEDKLQVWGER